jgi:hypothetical protein
MKRKEKVMKLWLAILLSIILTITVNAQAQDLKNLFNFDDEPQLEYLALSDASSDDDAGKDPSIKVQVQDQEELWDIGAGLRLNYLRLTGSISGFDAQTGNTFDIDYSEVGMDNYAASLALALAGKYKKFNLFFGASRGSYTGSFLSKNDVTIDDETIPAGSTVNGKIDMGIYSLSTTYGLIQKKHDLGLGFGILLLDMGMEFSAGGKTIGEPQIFPMPFLALSGRLNFDRLRIVAVGGGAYFNGDMEGYDYTVWYYTFDVRAGYEFYKKENCSAIANLGYRSLHMDSKASKGATWFEEKDSYSGPFISILVKYTKFI